MGNKKPVGSPGNSGILQHTFNFDPTFYNVHVPANSELKFFSEIFSLIDAMRERDTLHQLTKKIREVEGAVECDFIIQMLKDEQLIDTDGLITCSEQGLPFLLESLYQVVYSIVTDRFVSCMHTSTLGCLAWQTGQNYMENVTTGQNKEESGEEHNNNSITPSSIENDSYQLKRKAKAWLDLAERFQDLAKYQHQHIKIHHDFQKRNSDPRTQGIYGSTFATIILGILFLIITNCTTTEAREFVHMLNK